MIEQRARAIAEDILFPAAMAVDAADRVPASHLDLLAATGFYGIANDPAVDYATLCRVVETLASGCLTTAFVWMQSLTPVRAAAAADRADLLPALVAGERRGGIGLAGIRNPSRSAPGTASRRRVRADRTGSVGHRLGHDRLCLRGRRSTTT